MMTTLEVLRKLAANRGPAEGRAYGICSYLRRNAYTNLSELEEAFRRWPEYSGDVDYPVPYWPMSPDAAYNATDDVWVGEYGEARLRLVDFLIGECERGALS
jgi:hypothetical protein